MDPVAIYYHPVFMEHETGEHVENKRRLEVAKRVLEESHLELQWLTPAPAPLKAIARVHEQAHIDNVRRVAEQGGGWLDADTVVSGRSYEAALVAAGAGLQAVERSLAGGQKAFLLVRPPGHHATRTRAMGFCLFNNIAIAAAYALEELGASRVLIVDWDVHHGNGTQAVFYEDPRVLFFSMHQAGHYPGTGRASEVGAGAGAGFTVNVPLQAGAGDGAVRLAFESLLLPLARAFLPSVILVSAGYDAQRGDFLGGLGFSQDAYRWMSASLVDLGREIDACGPVCFLEGGYVPEMVAGSIVATIGGMQGERPSFEVVASPDDKADVRESVEETKAHWRNVL